MLIDKCVFKITGIGHAGPSIRVQVSARNQYSLAKMVKANTP